MDKARANNVRFPKLRSEGRITRLDAAAKVKNSYFFGEVTLEFKLARETMSGGKHYTSEVARQILVNWSSMRCVEC